MINTSIHIAVQEQKPNACTVHCTCLRGESTYESSAVTIMYEHSAHIVRYLLSEKREQYSHHIRMREKSNSACSLNRYGVNMN